MILSSEPSMQNIALFWDPCHPHGWQWAILPGSIISPFTPGFFHEKMEGIWIGMMPIPYYNPIIYIYIYIWMGFLGPNTLSNYNVFDRRPVLRKQLLNVRMIIQLLLGEGSARHGPGHGRWHFKFKVSSTHVCWCYCCALFGMDVPSTVSVPLALF